MSTNILPEAEISQGICGSCGGATWSRQDHPEMTEHALLCVYWQCEDCGACFRDGAGHQATPPIPVVRTQVVENGRDERGHECFAVHSQSGKQYRVVYEGTGDGDPDVVSLWSCSCPAYKYRGGTCKHITAVIEFCDNREGQ